MKHILVLLMVVGSLFASIGEITAINGKAYALRGGKSVALVKGSKLEKRDTIKTLANTRLQIVFIDHTVISLGQKTNFKVDKYDFNRKNKEARFSVSRGIFKSITGKIGHLNHSKYTLKTRNATIGVRGTIYVGRVEADKESIACTSGEIVVYTKKGSVVVKKGEITTFAPHSAPTKPKRYREKNLNLFKGVITNSDKEVLKHSIQKVKKETKQDTFGDFESEQIEKVAQEDEKTTSKSVKKAPHDKLQSVEGSKSSKSDEDKKKSVEKEKSKEDMTTKETTKKESQPKEDTKNKDNDNQTQKLKKDETNTQETTQAVKETKQDTFGDFESEQIEKVAQEDEKTTSKSVKKAPHDKLQSVEGSKSSKSDEDKKKSVEKEKSKEDMTTKETTKKESQPKEDTKNKDNDNQTQKLKKDETNTQETTQAVKETQTQKQKEEKNTNSATNETKQENTDSGDFAENIDGSLNQNNTASSKEDTDNTTADNNYGDFGNEQMNEQEQEDNSASETTSDKNNEFADLIERGGSSHLHYHGKVSGSDVLDNNHNSINLDFDLGKATVDGRVKFDKQNSIPMGSYTTEYDTNIAGSVNPNGNFDFQTTSNHYSGGGNGELTGEHLEQASGNLNIKKTFMGVRTDTTSATFTATKQ